MQKFLLLATAAVAQVQAQGRVWRLALSDPQPPGPLTGCGLDEIEQAMTYYTIDGTSGCQALVGANTPGATHYSFVNSTGNSCLKAGCDDECHICSFYQGNCTTGGSGSGSGHPPSHDTLEDTLSDQVLTCDTTVSGRTEANGMSYLGNPSPDQLLTLRVATAGAFTLNACTSAFSTVLRVFDLDGEELKTCTSCECAVELEAGEYALLVEGDDQAVASTGAFDVSMQCGGRIGRRMAEVFDQTAPVQFNTCYRAAPYDGMVTSAFLFQMLEYNSSDSTQVHDRGLCLLEPPSSRAKINSIELHWVGGTCDVGSDKTRFQATVRATVIDDNNECERMSGTHLFQNINVNGTSGEYDIKIGCVDSNCTANCTVNQANVLDRALCLDHVWKVYDTPSFNTCGGERPDTPIPKKSKAPVAAIVGSVIGALAVGGGVFFVLRRRKLSRMNAYAVLQDDPAF